MRFAICCLLVLAACDECEIGESRCDNGRVMACDDRDLGGTAFREIVGCCGSSTCKDIVYDSQRQGVCTASQDPDPACASGNGYTCADDATLVSCAFGYASWRVRCEGVCVTSPSGYAFCAVSGAPDPRCAAGSGAVVAWCDGQLAYECEGEMLSVWRCADDAPCIVTRLIDGSVTGAACDKPADPACYQ